MSEAKKMKLELASGVEGAENEESQHGALGDGAQMVFGEALKAMTGNTFPQMAATIAATEVVSQDKEATLVNDVNSLRVDSMTQQAQPPVESAVDDVNDLNESTTLQPQLLAGSAASNDNQWQLSYCEPWQTDKSLLDSLKYMLENSIDTDVTFIVGPNSEAGNSSEKVSAHKMLMVARSPVFAYMLNNLKYQHCPIEITDTDVTPQAFRDMLWFLYTDSVEVLPETVISLFHLANKYAISGLKKICLNFMMKSLDYVNVCMILDQSLCFGEDSLAVKCFDLISRHAKECLESESFLMLSRHALSRILDLEKLAIKEVDLIQRVVAWATKRCEENQKESTGENLREALGDECIHKIRFANINIADFTRVVSPIGILTRDEELTFYRHLGDRAVAVPEGFSDKKERLR